MAPKTPPRKYPGTAAGLFLSIAIYLFLTKEHTPINLSIISIIFGGLLFLKLIFVIFPLTLLPLFSILFLLKCERKKNLAFLFIAFLILGGLFMVFNYSTFENTKMLGGYHSNLDKQMKGVFISTVDETIDNPPIFITYADRLVVGLLTFLFNPTYGLFIFSPLALVATFGLPMFWKKQKTAFIVLVSTFVVFLAIMSWGISPGGSWSLPARYLIPIIPLFTIPLAYLIDKYSKNVLLSTLIFITSAFGIAFNIIFANVIRGHLYRFERSEIANFVYGEIGQLFPIPNVICPNCGIEYSVHNTNPMFWIFLSTLIFIFLIIVIKNNFSKIKKQKIIYLLLGTIIISPTIAYAGLTYFDYYSESIVNNTFFEYLGRLPNDSELEFYKNEILQNDKSALWVQKSIMSSNEFEDLSYEKKLEKQITDLYKTILNRPPDELGLNYFKLQILENDKTIDWVRDAIMNSEEAKSIP